MSSDDQSDPSDLVNLLRHATRAGELSPERNRELVARALDTAFASTLLGEEPTKEEVEAAAPLNSALETGAYHPLFDVIQALQAAVPGQHAQLNELANRRLVAVALGERSWIMRAPLLVTAVAAAAAAFLLLHNSVRSPDAPVNALRLQASTQSLLNGPLALASTSERMDRIAELRTQDLRNNRYAQWGIK